MEKLVKKNIPDYAGTGTVCVKTSMIGFVGWMFAEFGVDR